MYTITQIGNVLQRLLNCTSSEETELFLPFQNAYPGSLSNNIDRLRHPCPIRYGRDINILRSAIDHLPNSSCAGIEIVDTIGYGTRKIGKQMFD
jgi:hypothetical protein